MILLPILMISDIVAVGKMVTAFDSMYDAFIIRILN